MRIAFIVPYLYRFQRGIESSACRLASTLSELGHEVTILAWAQPSPQAQPVLAPEVEVLTVPYFRYFRARIAALFYARVLRRGDFDLVNIYFADCGEAGPIRRTKTSKGYRVQFIAGYPVELVPHRFDAFDRLGLTPLLDRVVAKSPAMEPGLRERMRRPTVMIPNGVDTVRFSPARYSREACRKELRIEGADPLIVTIAALEERKGIQHVLRALPQLLSEYPGLRYLIAGEGPFDPQLSSEVKRLGLEPQVRFLGRLEDVRPLLGAADLVALLSYGEGLPNVILEAWSMDLPVLVSRHPPYPDLMNETLGLMVDEHDVVQVGTCIDSMLARANASADGRRRDHVIRNYSWHRVAEAIVNLDKTNE